MFRSYVNMAVRSLLRHPGYTGINILGLSMGIGCCLLFLMFVQHELSYDSFHQRADRIYRVVDRLEWQNGEVDYLSMQPVEFANEAPKQVAGIEAASGFIKTSTGVRHEEREFETAVGLVHADFLNIFSFELLAGERESAIGDPLSVVIDGDLATRLYGLHQKEYQEAIGKTLTLDDVSERVFTVTGVMTPVPRNSSLHFEALASIDHHKGFSINRDISGAASTYVLLREGTSASLAESTLAPLLESLLAQRIEIMRTFSVWVLDRFSLELQPLHEVYLNKIGTWNSYEKEGSELGAQTLGGIALFVLSIGCVNFTTLAIARASSRVREVGIRKMLGAGRGRIRRQMWGEAVMLCCISLCVGVVFAELALPAFEGIVRRDLSLQDIPIWIQGWGLLGVLVLSAGIAGYPAMQLSRVEPAVSAKGKSGLGTRTRAIGALVILQFALTSGLMVSVILMREQLAYVLTKDLGFQKEEIAVLPTGSDSIGVRYKISVLANPLVQAATLSDRAFTDGWNTRQIDHPDRTPGSHLEVRIIRGDADYLKTLGIRQLTGRNFRTEEVAGVSNVVLVNETLARAFGERGPIGEQLAGLKIDERVNEPEVIGVIADYHVSSLHSVIPPTVLHLGRYMNRAKLIARLDPARTEEALAHMKETWDKVVAERPFNISWLDDRLRSQYQDEQRWGTITRYALAFAILISCLGMIGMSALSSDERRREVAVRKVLRATVQQVVSLLNRDFVKLVFVANILAALPAYYVMSRWLDTFAYRVNIGWELFGIVAVVSLGIAVAAISVQTVTAALADPVVGLRQE